MKWEFIYIGDRYNVHYSTLGISGLREYYDTNAFFQDKLSFDFQCVNFIFYESKGLDVDTTFIKQVQTLSPNFYIALISDQINDLDKKKYLKLGVTNNLSDNSFYMSC